MSIKVLVADDHDANRSILCRRLEKRGFRVLEACDGGHAIAVARSERPDVILMDMSMPVADGLEAWRAIKESVENPPVAIALTATIILDVRLKCHELGFKAFLEKPIEFEELVATIHKFAPAPSAAR